MRIDLPQCNLKNCRKCFDGNCTDKVEYEKCEYAHYKDLVEQGRLVELICKIGTLIYYLNGEFLLDGIYGEFLLDGICAGFSVDEDGAWLMHIQFNKSGLTHSCECSLLGKRFFFTKSEAEQALAERQE